MKIFIWGCYRQGNFGDDLMGVILGKLAQSVGHEVTVFGLSPLLAKRYNINIASDIDRSLKDCDCVVLGGGAFFKKYESSSQQINADLALLSKSISAHKKNVFCVSIGSDNANSLDQLAQSRKDILTSKYFQGGLVRLRRDVEIAKHKFNYCQDILTATPILIRRLGLSGGGKDSAGDADIVDCTVINIAWKRLLPNIRSLYLKSSKPIVFMRSHNPEFGVRSEAIFPFSKKYTNVDPVLTAIFLSRQRTVISSKLHTGIVAASFGVPFHSIAGNDKTKNFFQEYETHHVGITKQGLILDNALEQEKVADEYQHFFKNLYI